MEEENRVKFKETKQSEQHGTVLPCIISTLVCIMLSLIDMYTDIAQGIVHFTNHKRWYGHLTFALVFAPAIINSAYTAVTCYANNGKIVLGVRFPYTKLVYFLCFCLHGQLARLIIWLYGLYTGAVKYSLAKEMVMTNRDMSFYLEVFLESIPQMYLQLYIMIVIYGTYTKMGLITVLSSFLAGSWGVLLLFDSKSSKLFAFQLNMFWMASRVLAVAVLSSIRRWSTFLLLSLHFIFVLPLWFYEIKKQPFERRSERRGFCQTVVADIFYAILYAVCNTATPMVSAYYFILSVVFAIENIGCCVGVYYSGKIRRNITRDVRKNIHFKDWEYSTLFVAAFSVVTTIAFVQTCILFVLKHKSMVKTTFMRSNIIKIIQKIQPVKAFKQSVYYKRYKSTKNDQRATEIPSGQNA